MSKHTPGPWHVYMGELCYRSDEDDQSFGMSCPVCLSEPANAALARNAPTMLKALKLCHFDSLNMSLEDWHFVQSAIAAAEGADT